MNMLEATSAKIAEPESRGKSKKFFTPMDRKARQEAIEREEQFSLFYGNTLDDKHISITREGDVIGKSPATVHLYSKVTEQRNLPAALIPMSLIGNDIMQCLAAEMGGTFLQHEGAHEQKAKFLSEGLQIFSIIADDDCGKSDELKELRSMGKLIEARIEEVSK